MQFYIIYIVFLHKIVEDTGVEQPRETGSRRRCPGGSLCDHVVVLVVEGPVGEYPEGLILHPVAPDAVVVDAVPLEEAEGLLLAALGDVDEEFFLCFRPWGAMWERAFHRGMLSGVMVSRVSTSPNSRISPFLVVMTLLGYVTPWSHLTAYRLVSSLTMVTWSSVHVSWSTKGKRVAAMMRVILCLRRVGSTMGDGWRGRGIKGGAGGFIPVAGALWGNHKVFY